VGEEDGVGDAVGRGYLVGKLDGCDDEASSGSWDRRRAQY
jgi:hypothetical protein